MKLEYGCRLADSIKSILGFMRLITGPWLRKRMTLCFGSKICLGTETFRDRGHDGYDLLSGMAQEETK